MDDLLHQFGQRMKELRGAFGITQEGLAARSGLDRTYIGSVERGERNVSLLNIEAICHGLDVDIGYFFAYEPFAVHSASMKRAYRKPLEERFVYTAHEEERLLEWQINGGITDRELTKIGSVLMRHCVDLSRYGKVKLLIDIRSMLAEGQSFVFRPEVLDRWEQLQRWAVPYCDKVVVLCNSKFMQNQIQRQSVRSGIAPVQDCLYELDNQWMEEEAHERLGIVCLKP
ncbi:helix-turn-helix domain-containing protein [Cohnella silvisoli]|uniref:Helix-turn-helix transcriptional regulator n=1 Tax=Cohnella silvisoli TaxID=2873699 RepID=A0ABV1KS42_9BACL|nr:helix-turn-helix transcriptional regulator [Cohnella silvisoli]MCD9022619.1 helix-turn-helix domain-containing protein [Cohnella silvisoli]